MDEARLDKLLALLQDFDSAMLTTLNGARALRSRPMKVAQVTDRGRLWFITSVDSGKLDELTEFPYVNVCLQGGRRYVSVSGTVRAVRDRAKLRELWSADQRAWFEKGIDDPELILLELVPSHAEYWDRSGVRGLEHALEEAKAIAGGGPVRDSADTHGEIDFDR